MKQTKKTDEKALEHNTEIHYWTSLGENKDICVICDKIRQGHWTRNKDGTLKNFVVDSIQ